MIISDLNFCDFEIPSNCEIKGGVIPSVPIVSFAGAAGVSTAVGLTTQFHPTGASYAYGGAAAGGGAAALSLNGQATAIVIPVAYVA